MACRLDLGGAACCLENAKLGLELDGVPAEGLEGVAHALIVEPSGNRRQILETRERRHCRRFACCSLTLCHSSLPEEYDGCIGRGGLTP